MNVLPHSCRLYLRRFLREIALLWLVSLSLTGFVLAGADHEITSRLAPLEVVFLVIVVIRLVLAEDVFGTTAGWRVRPLGGGALLRGRVAALLVAVLPLVVFRSLAWFSLAGAGLAGLRDVVWSDGLPVLAFILVLTVVVKLWRLLAARETAGIALLVVGPALLLGAFLWFAHSMKGMSRDYAVFGREDIPPALVQAMPEGTYFLGKLESRSRERVSHLMTMPLKPGTHRLGDRELRVTGVERLDDRLFLSMEFRTAGATDTTKDLIFAVKYADGSYAAGSPSRGSNRNMRFWLFRGRSEVRTAEYESPLSLPWNHRSWTELTNGAEILVFRRYPPRNDQPARRPMSLARTELAFLHAEEKVPADVARMSRAAGGDRMLDILSWPTWSDAAWQEMVKPFLLANARETDFSIFEDRLRTDPRLASVMVLKGKEPGPAIAELERRLRERLPLGREELAILADRRVPGMAGEMEEAFIALGWDWPRLRMRMELYPGIRSRGLGYLGWRRVLLEDAGPAKMDFFASWAASDGDASAFQYRAANGTDRTIAEYLPDYVEDPVQWLAEHGQRMTFDPERHIFVEGR